MHHRFGEERAYSISGLYTLLTLLLFSVASIVHYSSISTSQGISPNCWFATDSHKQRTNISKNPELCFSTLNRLQKIHLSCRSVNYLVIVVLLELYKFLEHPLRFNNRSNSPVFQHCSYIPIPYPDLLHPVPPTFTPTRKTTNRRSQSST